MSEPDGSKQGVIAALVAIPIMIACCAAPVFTLGLVTTIFGWFSGLGLIEIVGLLGIIAAAVLGFSRFKEAKKKK